MQGIEWEPLKFGTGTAIAANWVLEEVEALGRVGAIAWNENQKRCKSSLGGCKRFSSVKSQPSTDLNLCDRWQLPMSKCDANKHWRFMNKFSGATTENRLLEETTLKMMRNYTWAGLISSSSCYL